MGCLVLIALKTTVFVGQMIAVIDAIAQSVQSLYFQLLSSASALFQFLLLTRRLLVFQINIVKDANPAIVGFSNKYRKGSSI